METAVGACNSVRYSVDVRYWECPLIESPLYCLWCLEKVRVDIEQHFKKLNILKAFVGNAPAYKIAAEREILPAGILPHIG